MYQHNYKKLPYKKSITKFLKDYHVLYYLFGQFTKWKTKNGTEIMVRNLNKKHLFHIVELFGNTKIRKKYPYIWFRYLKEGDCYGTRKKL